MRKITGTYLGTISKESVRELRRKHLGMFEKWLRGHNLQVTKVAARDLLSFKQFLILTRRCKARTVASYFQTLRSFYSWMLRQGMINASPVSDIETKRRNIVRVNLTNEQLRTLGQRYMTHALRDWLLFSIMVLPGFTPEEVANIRMSDVRLDRVPRIILSKDTLIYINPEIQPILRQYLKCFPNSEWLFHDAEGAKLSVSEVRRVRREGMRRIKYINIQQ